MNKKPLWQRLQIVGHELLTISHTSAAPIGRSSPGVDRNHAPAYQDASDVGGLHKAEVERAIRLIAEGIRLLENAVAAHKGRMQVRRYDDLIGPELDRVILRDFRGWYPEDIAQAHSELGDALYIRRLRSRNNVDPETGK